MAPSSELRFVDLGRDVPYADALAEQMRLHAARCRGEVADTVLLLEHRPVFTLGRSAEASHVLWDAARLKGEGIEVVEADRGGDVTYHGPGQLVAYPVVGLAERGMGVLDFVSALEEAAIRTAAALGLEGAGRDPRNRGVWVRGRKLCAIGIRVSRGVTRHGLALNVNTRLADFAGIVPCGLAGVGVTSLAQELGRPLDMALARTALSRALAETLRVRKDRRAAVSLR